MARKIWSLTLLILAFSSGLQAQGGLVPAEYTLLPGDTLEISVWKEPELQREVMIRPDGRFSFPLMGEIVAVGKTVSQVQNELSQKIIRYIPEAVLTVTVIGVGGNKVYVLGQVNNPGEFVVNPSVDVVQALSVAGGLSAFASANDIIILRRTGDRRETLRFRYGDIEKGRNLEQNVVLRPGDVVVVP